MGIVAKLSNLFSSKHNILLFLLRELMEEKKWVRKNTFTFFLTHSSSKLFSLISGCGDSGSTIP